ncbi:zinc finger and BTB domain-containing protein 17-like isoform X1 [Formica exsecta]|uniref:zinc finger and BTB domain-containing protein 17-like isoform X1 n=1 Tax=Formica exsecta TaxID=72781 RepID=UPI001141E18E|nr:zinc finger and BTB domain-containing protein 17-like isoform X1 [Formica exsecta]XP_029661793.1 zinc finger and BTB domain-containing protein 17-like isoform X1 [Formica exsecta]XP_029661794.1 zinc finger and BTB domain-containing protein 17-like isoform X1 [Formica exsecta]
MEDDQQFCLRWNNHQSTLIQNFDTLLESGTLVDCTLAAEGKTLKAHKVVLSACSPYFECLLSEHYDKHPVFILKDVKFKELKAMMDYMYRGEVNISQDQLAALLKAAESLQIKGLSESKTAGSSKTESRPQKTVSQPIARVSPSLDIPHASSGLTIEKNKVPRQSMAQGPVGDIPEDTASPQGPKRLCSREGSQSPTTRKRKRFRRGSLGEDSTIEMQDASNSSDMPQQMGVPALGITPVADEKVHADSTDSLGRSALMTQLTKPADEMLQLPLEKPEPNDNLIEPKSEYLEESEECVEDLTLDDDMNDLNDMEQDNNRAGPSHDPTQHPAGIGAWHVTGDRSNAGGVVGTLTGAGATGATDEMFLTPQEATAQQQRDSQEGEVSVVKKEKPCEETKKLLEREKEKNKSERSKRSNLTNGVATTSIASRPSTSITPRPSMSTDIRHSKVSEVISLSDSENSDNEGSSPWTNSKNIVQQKPKCPHCGIKYERRHHLVKHITMTCMSNPDSKANKEAGKFRCVDCGRNYGQAKSLRYHQKHECQQVITCPDCHRTMRGTYITERHKQNHCVKKQRSKKIKQEDSPDELFIDDSSIEF